jgi:hypothetical protein
MKASAAVVIRVLVIMGTVLGVDRERKQER